MSPPPGEGAVLIIFGMCEASKKKKDDNLLADNMVLLTDNPKLSFGEFCHTKHIYKYFLILLKITFFKTKQGIYFVFFLLQYIMTFYVSGLFKISNG
jgi:hypothetical protein